MATIDDIQRMQFDDLAGAEALALRWLQQELMLPATSVTLTPKAVSLNSFNGFAVIDHEEVFFKSHVEPDSVIAEYYNAESLYEAGYNIVRPLRTVHESGQQIAFYPRIAAPAVFDIVRNIEVGTSDIERTDAILKAEQQECVRLLDVYLNSSSEVVAEENAKAPVHQLFWHRLTGERYQSFYGASSLALPDDSGAFRFEELLTKTFIVNGVEQPRTLLSLKKEASFVLNPTQPALVAPGHGDAHFGNVFLEDGERFLYFDPAFGGKHSPLLDVVKPLYHNVFAQWMYFPEDKAEQLQTNVKVEGDRLSIEYQPYVPPIRQRLLEIKQHELVEPLLATLAERDGSPYGARMVHLALMCCPLLTMNLTDTKKFPNAVSWAGLAQVLQMGNWDVEQNFGFAQ